MANHIRLEPAASVLSVIGVGNASEVTGIDRTQIWRWTQPKSKKGTGGLIPSDHQGPLLEYAERHGLPVTADMMIRRPSKFRVSRVGARR